MCRRSAAACSGTGRAATHNNLELLTCCVYAKVSTWPLQPPPSPASTLSSPNKASPSTLNHASNHLTPARSTASTVHRAHGRQSRPAPTSAYQTNTRVLCVECTVLPQPRASLPHYLGDIYDPNIERCPPSPPNTHPAPLKTTQGKARQSVSKQTWLTPATQNSCPPPVPP